MMDGDSRGMAKRKFVIVLISVAYGDDGYASSGGGRHPLNQPRQRYGFIAQCADEGVLGPYVDIEVEAYDECNTIIDVHRQRGRCRFGVGASVSWVGAWMTAAVHPDRIAL